MCELPDLGERYEIFKLISAGTTSSVYFAKQQPLERNVAIKILNVNSDNADRRQRFLREAKILAQLNHANIVAVHDFGESSGRLPYIVMEHLEGRLLSSIITESVIPLERIFHIAFQLAGALQVAHEAGIAHLDLKPQNVMVLQSNDRKGVIKLLDFGIAESIGGEQPTIRGTPRFMAPERFAGFPPDPRSEVYSFGLLLFTMITGQPPFLGETPSDLEAQHRDEEVPAIHALERGQECPQALQAIVSRSLAKSPGDRFQSILELKRALRGCFFDMFNTDRAPQSTKTAPLNERTEEDLKRTPAMAMPMESLSVESDSSNRRWLLLLLLPLLLVGYILWPKDDGVVAEKLPVAAPVERTVESPPEKSTETAAKSGAPSEPPAEPSTAVEASEAPKPAEAEPTALEEAKPVEAKTLARRRVRRGAAQAKKRRAKADARRAKERKAKSAADEKAREAARKKETRRPVIGVVDDEDRPNIGVVDE